MLTQIILYVGVSRVHEHRHSPNSGSAKLLNPRRSTEATNTPSPQATCTVHCFVDIGKITKITDNNLHLIIQV
jgi:hypothetical protein